jgi:predicted nuclease of predicted toxin-antitoxin system
MKILVDNNISPRTISYHGKFFKDSNHVVQLNLDIDTEDIAIWEFAKKNNFAILTKDNDFEAMSRLYGCPPKVIQLICGNKSTNEIIKILSNKHSSIKKFLEDKTDCLLYIG